MFDRRVVRFGSILLLLAIPVFLAGAGCPRRDLAPTRVKWVEKPSNGTISFIGVVTNVGNVAISGREFKVVVGSESPVGGIMVNTTVKVPASVSIAPGGEFETDAVAMQKLYRGQKYRVDVLVDPDRVLGEVNAQNNLLTTYVQTMH